MFSKCTTTKQQGNIGVSHAIQYFSSKCYTVSIPLNDSQDYDLVVDIDNTLHKVQVKTTKFKSPSGNFTASLKNSGGSSREIYGHVNTGNCTLLYILCSNGDAYLLPRDVFVDISTSITLGEKYFEYLVI